MPTIQVEAQVSADQLLRAVEQMPAKELSAFISQVLALRAERNAPHLAHDEASLLQVINAALPAATQQRIDELVAGRQAETLSPEEHAELLRLSNKAEQRDAERMAALAALAELRRTSVRDLMRGLGLQAPLYV